MTITNHNSDRFSKGSLGVIKRKCPYCLHHKALTSNTLVKCAKCKKILEQD